MPLTPTPPGDPKPSKDAPTTGRKVLDQPGSEGATAVLLEQSDEAKALMVERGWDKGYVVFGAPPSEATVKVLTAVSLVEGTDFKLVEVPYNPTTPPLQLTNTSANPTIPANLRCLQPCPPHRRPPPPHPRSVLTTPYWARKTSLALSLRRGRCSPPVGRACPPWRSMERCTLSPS